MAIPPGCLIRPTPNCPDPFVPRHASKMSFFADIWPIALAAIQFGAMLGAAGHAMLTKSDVRSAAGWVGFILLVPFLGWLIYLLMGVNRIRPRIAWRTARYDPAAAKAPPIRTALS